MAQQENLNTTYASWRDVVVQKKTTVFSLRVPKREMQQLKFMAHQLQLSMNSLCLMGIQSHNRKLLREFDEDTQSGRVV